MFFSSTFCEHTSGINYRSLPALELGRKKWREVEKPVELLS